MAEELADAKQSGDPAPRTLDEQIATLADLLKDEPQTVIKAAVKRIAEAWARRRHEGVPSRPEPEQSKAATKKPRGRKSKGLATIHDD